MSRAPAVARRRYFAPEVIQTSVMDCGPASLKCLLTGCGVDVGYGRLREACQTDVDGTSIDVLEDVAVQLGLDAEQVMVPADHLGLVEASLFPALVVVKLPHAPVHFLVAWRAHGRLIQVMDPGVGRRWVSRDALTRELYVHEHRLPAEAVRQWLGTPAFLAPLRRRIADLGVPSATGNRILEWADADSTWYRLGAVDAAVRMLETVARAGGIARGRALLGVLERLVTATPGDGAIPTTFWSVRPLKGAADEVVFRGAVLVTVRGRGQTARTSSSDLRAPATPLAPELLAALHEPSTAPWRQVLRMLREDGLLAPTALMAALMVSLVAGSLQALVLRGLLDLGRSLGLGTQRLFAMGAAVFLFGAMTLVSLPISVNLLRIGRRLELRLRAAFLAKLPRIADRYFHSRLMSDMADRAHAVTVLRGLPRVGFSMVTSVFQMLLTTAGLIWLQPSCAPAALTVIAVSVAVGWLTQAIMSERDLRVRTHAGALSRFCLDGLLGIWCVRAHGAQRSLMREHEALLTFWTSAQLRLQRGAIALDALQSVLSTALAAWLVFGQAAQPGREGSTLLFAFWALQLPVLGQGIVAAARQVPGIRNVTARLLEPLTTPEDPVGVYAEEGEATQPKRGPYLRFEGVSARAGGHTVLEGLDLEIAPGSHVAIVGESGAGKSTLVGLLLGWHRPATGTIWVDGQPLEPDRLAALRQRTAWVDPSVMLYNRRFIDNLTYGSGTSTGTGAKNPGWAVEAAELREVLERLPEGLQTSLGEGGALVSGGEGQRVRLARAMMRRGTRLAILDEPFRGLDRDRRRTLLRRARRLWKDATMLCVTHDIGETLRFDRVLVVEGGRIVEDADPGYLAGQPESRYAALLAAEQSLRGGLWSGALWRRLRVERGVVTEGPRTAGHEPHRFPTVAADPAARARAEAADG